MEKYIVLEYAYNYGLSIVSARRFTAEEQKGYAEWFRESGFVSLGDSVELAIDPSHPYIQELINSRPSDGSFCGCSNAAWIITEDEKAEILAQNDAFLAGKAAKETADAIAYLEKVIEACERQQKASKLYTQAEAAAKRAQYNDVYNEGGEGYVPHYYTIDEYNHALEELEKLQSRA